MAQNAMTNLSKISPAVTLIAMFITGAIAFYAGQAVAEHDGKAEVHLVAKNAHEKDEDAHLHMQKKLIKEIADDLANSIASKVVSQLEQREAPSADAL